MKKYAFFQHIAATGELYYMGEDIADGSRVWIKAIPPVHTVSLVGSPLSSLVTTDQVMYTHLIPEAYVAEVSKIYGTPLQRIDMSQSQPPQWKFQSQPPQWKFQSMAFNPNSFKGWMGSSGYI